MVEDRTDQIQVENNVDLVLLSEKLLEKMKKRRSIRSFSNKAIPEKVIKNCIAIAASAPSGANMQPWSFVLVSDNNTKREIKKKAEEAEKRFYSEEITKEWRSRLAPLETTYKKGFLEEAPYLICIFAQRYGIDSGGNKVKRYYVMESVGIATGFLISALHQLGISMLTYTPAPMTFLRELLKRPINERPYMILAVGYPNEKYKPPKLAKKTEEEYLTVV